MEPTVVSRYKIILIAGFGEAYGGVRFGEIRGRDYWEVVQTMYISQQLVLELMVNPKA